MQVAAASDLFGAANRGPSTKLAWTVIKPSNATEKHRPVDMMAESTGSVDRFDYRDESFPKMKVRDGADVSALEGLPTRLK